MSLNRAGGSTQGSPAIEHKSSFLGHATTIIVLGTFYMCSPPSWYGPSWSYFYHHGVPLIQPGGFGLGVCLAGIGIAQLITLWRDAARILPVLFFLSGFVFWVAGSILAAEGVLGHLGLQEAPLLLVIGAFKFITMINLVIRRRDRRAQ